MEKIELDLLFSKLNQIQQVLKLKMIKIVLPLMLISICAVNVRELS